MTESSAPALTRGIEILRLMDDRERRSLEEIAGATGFPKSSLTRLLETLVNLDLLTRDPASKKYLARAVLIPLRNTGDGFEEKLSQTLSILAERTGCTAEWYVPGGKGMVLVRRTEPRSGEVRVSARIGFLREWTGELEAVNAVANAFIHSQQGQASYNMFQRDGIRDELSSEEARARIAQAATDGFMLDHAWNTQGVRRTAMIIKRGETALGILALAQSMRPTDSTSPEELGAILLEEGKRLH